ncbi:disease resistance protein RPH8A, putative [Acetobacter orientalis]|uniref:Disease resistance protein RPH8A, putative n=1 Tax=Acetobacter orientalis TaxID=146474 RepID=A0A2Z5ZJ58_9PROT|nr:disease resistance protein RPH8A, putative [Acetobacter orientalis]
MGRLFCYDTPKLQCLWGLPLRVCTLKSGLCAPMAHNSLLKISN